MQNPVAVHRQGAQEILSCVTGSLPVRCKAGWVVQRICKKSCSQHLARGYQVQPRSLGVCGLAGSLAFAALYGSGVSSTHCATAAGTPGARSVSASQTRGKAETLTRLPPSLGKDPSVAGQWMRSGWSTLRGRTVAVWERRSLMQQVLAPVHAPSHSH